MPWKALNLDVRGNLKPCCMFTRGVLPFKKPDDLQNYLEGPELAAVKDEMLKGSAPSECAACIQEEALGIFSVRQDAAARYGPDPSNLSEIEISLTNTCNLICVMCNSQFSSKWESLQAKLAREYEWISPPEQTIRFNFEAGHLDALSPIFEQVRYVRLIGGEPLLSPALVPLLKKLKQYPNINSINITSNLTRLEPELLETLAGTPALDLSCSIDGIGKTYFWMRGMEWEKIERNLDKLADYEVKFQIGPTIQLANAFNVIELWHWAKQKGFSIRLNHLLRQPEFLGLKYLPQEMWPELKALLSRLPEPAARAMRRYLEVNQAQTQNLERTRIWIREFDQLRGLRLAEVDPRYRFLYSEQSEASRI